MNTRTAERPAGTQTRRASNKRAIAVASGAAVLLAAALLLVATTLPDTSGVTTLPRRPTVPSAAQTGGARGTGTPTAAGTGTFGYQPLWPFAGSAAAGAWQRAYRADATYQNWHLNAGVTALSFARGYLGYSDLDKVVDFSVKGGQAWVRVGYEGAAAPAGTVHLARLGSGGDAPWEVVGTTESGPGSTGGGSAVPGAALSISTPAYGGTVTSPLAVRGRITGTDESMRVLVRSLAGVLGQASGFSAGGVEAAWSAQLGFTAPARTVLAVAVSSGGHVRAVERFAVTAVVAGASARPATDVDGDGIADTVRLVQPDGVRVDYGSGRVDVVSFSAADGWNPVLLGEVDADGDGRAEVFARTGPTTSAVFRYVSGRLRVVTLAGVQADLTMVSVGADRSSWACGRTGDGGAVTVWAGRQTGAAVYDGTLRDYAFDGAELSQLHSEPYEVGAGKRAPVGCGNLAV